MAASTRSAVAGCTPGSSLTTRDTVLMLTPASRATSFIVARRTLRPAALATAGAPFADNVVIVAAFHTRHTVRVNVSVPIQLVKRPSAPDRMVRAAVDNGV